MKRAIAQGVVIGLILSALGLVGLCVLGCTLHLHVGERHYCGSAATQPAQTTLGSPNPDVILEVE